MQVTHRATVCYLRASSMEFPQRKLIPPEEAPLHIGPLAMNRSGQGKSRCALGPCTLRPRQSIYHGSRHYEGQKSCVWATSLLLENNNIDGFQKVRKNYISLVNSSVYSQNLLVCTVKKFLRT